MISKLKQKSPNAKIIQLNIEHYQTDEKFDYIFITSGSVSLFTDMKLCQNILQKMKNLLKTNGKFIFAVDTIANCCEDDTVLAVKTKENYDLILKTKNHYDAQTHTQFSPGIYELYDGKIYYNLNKWISKHIFMNSEKWKIFCVKYILTKLLYILILISQLL